MEGLHRALYLYVDVAQVEQVHIHACCLGSSGITFQEETRSTAKYYALYLYLSNTPLFHLTSSLCSDKFTSMLAVWDPLASPFK
mmetsp:Transcript_9413/g.14375  ORF Transcript_9413/g.14375 Transcript_9413/m.14375 type:complete len:84 (+) Transcript_9413:234-485(+)